MQFTQTIPADKPRKHVFIGMGASEGTVEVPCCAALFAASPLFRAAEITLTLCIEAGNCHVDDMRNSIVRAFLESDADELIFIDEDVGFDAADLLKLAMHKRDVVGGVYPKKEDEPNFPVYVDPGTDLYGDSAGLVEVHGLPTGFLKFKRHVVQSLWDDAAKWIGNDGCQYAQVFERVIRDGMKWSHDYAVCRKWIDKGGKVYADPDMTFSHTGRKTWVGNLADHWRYTNGIAAENGSDGLKSAIQAIYDGDADMGDFIALYRFANNRWAADPDVLEAVYTAARKSNGAIIETGSGLTTLVAAAAGNGEDIHALEHLPFYAEQTDKWARMAELDNVNIHCGPLGMDNWYQLEAFDLPERFALGICDGPPRAFGSRMEFFKRLAHRCATIIVDDMDTSPEYAAEVEAWAKANGRKYERHDRVAIIHEPAECPSKTLTEA